MNLSARLFKDIKKVAISIIHIKWTKKRVFCLLLIGEIILESAYNLFLPPQVQAATVPLKIYLRLDRLKASTTTSGTVCLNPVSTETTVNDVQVTFPTGFTVNTTASNWTVSTTNLPIISNVTATAWPNITTATAVSSQTVTFAESSTATLTTGTVYCFNFAAASTLTTSTAGNNETGTIAIRNSTPTVLEQNTYAVSIISNDQISVTATVGPTFTFTLSGNSDPLGTLSTSAVTTTTGITATTSTNANSGWALWVKSLNGALNSPTLGAGSNITSPGTYATQSPSTFPIDGSASDYGLVASVTSQNAGSPAGSGTITIDPEYVVVSNKAGHLDTTFDPIATSNGTQNQGQVLLQERAVISNVQKAATDYADTLTVTASGLF